jgi:hypothetical protein
MEYEATPGTAPSGDDPAEPFDPVGPVPPDDYDPFDYAVRDGFVLLGEHQAQVDAAVTAEQTLAETDAFAGDSSAIDGTNQIVLGWVDVAAAYAAVPEQEQAEFAEMFGSAEPAGRMVLGLHAEPDAIEATGRTFDLEAAGTQALATGGPGTGLVLDLPAETDIALSATGLGDVAAELWKTYGEESAYDLGAEAEKLGLVLPEDLRSLFGQEAALGIAAPVEGSDEIRAAARVATDRADRALEVIEIAQQMDMEKVHTSLAPDGYVLGTDEEAMTEAADGDRSLTGNETFTHAVPDAEDASALFFVDLRPVVAMLSSWGGSAEEPESESGWDTLEAIGVTATGERGNGELRIRLTFR